MLRKLMPNFNV